MMWYLANQPPIASPSTLFLKMDLDRLKEDLIYMTDEGIGCLNDKLTPYGLEIKDNIREHGRKRLLNNMGE